MLRIAALLLALLASTAVVAESVLKVAVVGPMSGRYASHGEQLRAGAERAVRDLSARGGAEGVKLEIVYADDACRRATAVDVAQRLVREGVRVVTGHVCSGASQAASGIYASANVIHFSLATIGPSARGARLGPTIFHMTGGDDGQGDVAGAFLARRHADKRIAIVHDRTLYGATLAEDARRALRRFGITEVLFEPVRPGEKDYGGLIAKVKQVGAEMIYFGGFPTEAGIIVRQLHAEGLSHVVLLGGDVLATPDFWSLAGRPAQGTLLTFKPDVGRMLTPDSDNAIARDLAKYGGNHALYAYAGIEMIASALAAAKSADSQTISAHISDAPSRTLLGEIAFDEKGRSNLPAFVIHRWQDGTLIQLE